MLAHANNVADELLSKLELIVSAKQQGATARCHNSVQASATLIRTVVLPGFTHIIRGHNPGAILAACRRVDDAAYGHFLALCNIRGETGVPLDNHSRERFFLPLTLGGFGMMSMERSAASAYVGQWACSAMTIDLAINLSKNCEQDYLGRTNADARSEAAATGSAVPSQPERADDFDDFGVFGPGVQLPGSYSHGLVSFAPDSSQAGATADLRLFPGLLEAWESVRHASSVANLSVFHFLTAPRGQLQKDLSVDLGRQRFDCLLEQVTPQQRAQLVESTGGLLRFALGAFPIVPPNKIANVPYIAAARELLFLGPRDPANPLFVEANPESSCRQCGAPVNCDESARYPDCGHAFVKKRVCKALQPQRTHLSSRLQQRITDLRRAAGLSDPLGGDLREPVEVKGGRRD